MQIHLNNLKNNKKWINILINLRFMTYGDIQNLEAIYEKEYFC